MLANKIKSTKVKDIYRILIILILSVLLRFIAPCRTNQRSADSNLRFIDFTYCTHRLLCPQLKVRKILRDDAALPLD